MESIVDKVLQEGFVFLKRNMPQKLADQFLKLEYQKSSYKNEYGVEDMMWRVKYLPSNLEDQYKTWLNEVLVDYPDVLEFVNDRFKYNSHKVTKGEGFKVHTDYYEEGIFQILCWVCKDKDFEGREFLHGKKEDLKKIKPQTGLICLMDILNPDFYHGVSELKTDTEIVTVCGFDETDLTIGEGEGK